MQCWCMYEYEMQRIWDSMSVSTQDSSNHITCSCLYDFTETFAVFPKYHPKSPWISQNIQNIQAYQKENLCTMCNIMESLSTTL